MTRSKVKIRPAVATVPLDEEVADSLTDAEKDWLRSWNRQDEIPGDEDEDEDEGGDEGYDSWNVDQLKDELSSRELPVSGNKQDLIDRLEEDDESS